MAQGSVPETVRDRHVCVSGGLLYKRSVNQSSGLDKMRIQSLTGVTATSVYIRLPIVQAVFQ